MRTKGCNHDMACMEGVLERPRYFPRQLMTPEEMTLEQTYFRDRMRRHNRLLHGWGVVCGVEGRQALDENGEPQPWTVQISPGYVLDCDGNEILIPETVTYDLRREALNGKNVRGGYEDDPWCSDVPVDRPIGETVYLAVCYDECETRPVRIHPAGCGCDDAGCENSRIRETFVVKVLTRLPEAYRDMDPRPLGRFEPCEMVSECPCCTGDPCVIIADIIPDDSGRLVIDCYAHRRYVLSLAHFFYTCQQRGGDQQATLDSAADFAERLMLHVDESAREILEADYAGAFGAAVELPFTTVRGLGAGSEVGQALSEMTIGEVATMEYEVFEKVTDALIADIEPNKRRWFENQRRLLWNRAREVARMTEPYRVP